MTCILYPVTCDLRPVICDLSLRSVTCASIRVKFVLCFRRLPFGIFQHRMTSLLKEQESAGSIEDDVIVYGRSVAEHDKRLQEVSENIVKSGQKLSEKKCEIRKPKIGYCGSVISEQGVSPDPDAEKVRAIQELPPPQNLFPNHDEC